jgi:acyl-CoA dehydrogenase
MAYQIGEKAKAIHERLEIFMEQHIYPREKDYDEFTSNHENLWQYPDWYEDLKKEAKKQELWNLFLPKEYAPWSPGLTNVEIAVLFETMSRSAWAQQVLTAMHQIEAIWKYWQNMVLQSSRKNGLILC